MRLKVLAFAAVIIAVGNTVFLSETALRPELNTISDILLVLLGIGLAPQYIAEWRKTNKIESLLIACLFTIIAAIHALRFFFGGLPV